MNEELKIKLDNLINQYKVMLFMKGTPEKPSCGFSAKAVQILLDSDIYFESFDIYSDEEIRQGLKVYKSWPTYPQLYINGELIGGVDIMTEMYDEGEFEEIKKSL
ncbi:Grx4 family monothiol glutaredoxin [Candidatus Gracilibacteria bacterium]|nr:Grx4 family monothiol glutaredoxin [Candidatus Gracilibacteria bacterium]